MSEARWAQQDGQHKGTGRIRRSGCQKFPDLDVLRGGLHRGPQTIATTP